VKSNILVIRLGALGDFIQSAGPFAAIRARHSQDQITLLTTAPFSALAQKSPWFDRVCLDPRPKLWQIGKILNLRHFLRSGPFSYVYDLQTSRRSSWYFHLMGGAPFWSGIARGCSHPDHNPRRCHIHTIERQASQLEQAGIPTIPQPDFSWLQSDIGQFGLTPPYALLCPGGSPHRPAKRWPWQKFADLAQALTKRGVRPVLIGTEAEQAEIKAIAQAVPACLDLCAQTSLFDLGQLARNAALAIGNDTGPMHLIAALDCPTLVLFSAESDPARCAPRGRVTIMRRDDLRELAGGDVINWAAAQTSPECGR
jgi:ADP-heptose:LPS heptosyltransferase